MPTIAGNDVYRFDAAESPLAPVPHSPALLRAPFGDRRYFAWDGALNAPISSHTYDNQEFLPQLDRFITFGGASYNAGRIFVLDDGVTKTGPYLCGSQPRRCKYGGRHGRLAGGSQHIS
jgi:hypothetical protein